MWPFLEGADGCGCGCQIVACPEGLPQKRVLPGAEPESFSHQLLSVEPQPEQEPQKPHLLEEQGENLGFPGTDAGALAKHISSVCTEKLLWLGGPGAGMEARSAPGLARSWKAAADSFCKRRAEVFNKRIRIVLQQFPTSPS